MAHSLIESLSKAKSMVHPHALNLYTIKKDKLPEQIE